MRKNWMLVLVFCFVATQLVGQKITDKNLRLTPVSIGFSYTYGNENNFLFDDPDYAYSANIFKAQFYYGLVRWRKANLQLVFEPQIQNLNHQLLNEQFVLPSEANYIEKRLRFTRKKQLSLFAFETAIQFDKQLLKQVAAFLRIGIGLAYIDTATERLAKGFTFIENANLGLSFLVDNNLSLEVFGGLGHVSNFDLQKPNSGYNSANMGIGVTYQLK